MLEFVLAMGIVGSFLVLIVTGHGKVRQPKTFDIDLIAAWNAVGFPFNTKETYGEMFGEAYFQVQYFNGVTYEDVAKGGSNPENLDGKPLLGRGYWIFVLEPMTLHLTEELYQSEP